MLSYQQLGAGVVQGVLFGLDRLVLTCGRGPAGLTYARREKSQVWHAPGSFPTENGRTARETNSPAYFSHVFLERTDAVFTQNPEGSSDRVSGRSLPHVYRLRRLGKG